MADVDATQLPLHPETEEVISETAEGLTPGQAKVYGLCVMTFRLLRKDHLPIIGILFVSALAAVIGAVIGEGLMLIGYGILKVAALIFGDGAIVGLYPLGYLILLFSIAIALFLRFREDGDIEAGVFEGKLRRLKLDRIDELLSVGAVGAAALFVGMTLAVQMNMLYLTNTHMGIDIEGGWVECCEVTLDNFFHGVLLDTVELYDLHFHDRVTHTFWSGTAFYAFRLTCDVLVIFSLVTLWRRQKATHIATSFAEVDENPTPEGMINYLREICYDNPKWVKHYVDEFVYLCLLEKYLSGDYDECRDWLDSFPHVKIPMIELFVDEDGEPILQARDILDLEQ